MVEEIPSRVGETLIKVLGISLYEKNIRCMVEECIEHCSKAPQNYCVSATGAHGIVTAKSDEIFKETLNSFHANLPDGMPSVWIGRVKGAKLMARCYGPDFFASMMEATSKLKINHYFCGGNEGVADELAQAVSEKFSNNNIVGTYSPPFREMTDIELKSLAREIGNKNSDIIWIGLSTPKQEKFARRLANYTKAKYIITVGAAFDFHTDRVRQAPALMQKMGLEWLFRLSVEPKRLWRRYFKIVPLFIWYNLLEYLQYKKLVKERI
jgi:N-acetylglucosaminyldiphosphoundecaprenol N-acetyl-beta-D-mannosaminyltransferase